MKTSKRAVQEYWDARPCGSFEPSGKLPLSAYFRAYERIRYEREPEITAFADFERWMQRQVLEIGVGIGADFVRFGRGGANTVGVDLSIRSLALARQNAEINQVVPTLLNADAESLPFADHAFDLVYSWGVLHHTPDMEGALREVHRVLKPGGECRVMLYHRRSLVGLQCYVRYGLTGFRPFASLSELIATHIESPGTRAYRVSEVRRLFHRFSGVDIRPVVTAYDVRFGRRVFAPRWLLNMVPNRLGWFLLIRAVK
jgi:SAM-dependent methyltransferase